MAPTKYNIAQLDASKKNWTITARVTRLWEVRYDRNKVQPDTLDMVLVDAQGTHIQASVPKEIVNHFKEKLQEGQIYTLRHFNVGRNLRKYKPVTNEYIVWFTSYTSINPEQDNQLHIPSHKFEFQPLQKLAERNNRQDIVTDVIGLLTALENPVTDEDGNTRRRLYIEDTMNTKVMTTLWNEVVEQIPPNLTINTDEPKILVISSTRVRQYQGNYQLNSTSATKIHVNLDIPEVRSIKEAVGESPPQITHIEAPQPESREEAMKKNRKTITELQQLYLDQEKNQDLNQTYTTIAKIEAVHVKEYNWRYESCRVCKSKLDGDHYCRKCHHTEEYPIQRYKIIISVTDGDTTMKMGLFEQNVEKLILLPISAMQLINAKVNGEEKIYEKFAKCLGSSYIFKVQLNKRGYLQELTAVKVFDIPTEDNNTQTPNNKNIDEDKGKKRTNEETPRTSTTDAQLQLQEPLKKLKPDIPTPRNTTEE